VITLYVLYGNTELKQQLQKVHCFCFEEDVILLVFLQSYSFLYYPHDSKFMSFFFFFSLNVVHKTFQEQYLFYLERVLSGAVVSEVKDLTRL